MRGAILILLGLFILFSACESDRDTVPDFNAVKYIWITDGGRFYLYNLYDYVHTSASGLEGHTISNVSVQLQYDYGSDADLSIVIAYPDKDTIILNTNSTGISPAVFIFPPFIYSSNSNLIIGISYSTTKEDKYFESIW